MSKRIIAFTKLEKMPEKAKDCPFFSMGACGACGDGYKTGCGGRFITVTDYVCPLREIEDCGGLSIMHVGEYWRSAFKRPPEEDLYLVTIKTGAYAEPRVAICRWVRDLRELDWTIFDDERPGWVYSRGTDLIEAKYVTAWMPLPAPYEERETEETHEGM